MEFALSQAGRNLVVAFAGAVNLEGEGATAFKDRIKALVEGGADRVVVDLGNVAFMDSQGLGALIGCLKALQQADGRLVLANVSSPVEAVLRVTRLHRVFDVRPTVADALAALAAPAVEPVHGAKP